MHQENAVLDREELLRLVENISEVVKNELNTYREVNDKRARIIKEAKEEAEEILYQAERTASRIRVTKRKDTEPPSFRASDLDKDEKDSLRMASDIYAASLIYTDEMLTEVDHLVADSYEKIEQEYARMRSTLRQKIEDIAENKAELMSNLNGLKANDRYAQILELSDLLSVELYNERQKAMAREREERAQMRFILNEDEETEVKQDNARPPISPDRTAVKIEQESKGGLEIEIMDRSDEVTNRDEGTGDVH
jgi:F0F1-type ATP synthase membrane subunit b/b'